VVRVGFQCDKKARAEHRSGSAQDECRGKAATVRDTAGSKDRYLTSHGIDDSRDEHQCRDFTPHMTTGFPTLRNDDIDSCLDSRGRFFDRPDGVNHQTARLVNRWNIRSGVAPEQRDEAGSLLETRCKAPVHIPGQH
jgi:hypothetical protein